MLALDPSVVKSLALPTVVSCDAPSGFLDTIRPARRLGLVIGDVLFTWRGGVLHSPLALLRSPMGTILAFLWEDSWRGKFRHLRRMFLPAAGLRARRTGLPAATSAGYRDTRVGCGKVAFNLPTKSTYSDVYGANRSRRHLDGHVLPTLRSGIIFPRRIAYNPQHS